MKRIEFGGLKDADLRHIFECGQCFRWNDEAGDGTYIGVAGGNICHAAIIGGGDGDSTLVLEATGGDRAFWHDYFDLSTDYGAIKRELMNRDDRIGEAISTGGGIRILRQDYYEVLLSFIISQNNNIPRIKKCIETMCERYGESLGWYAGRERFAFPRPEVIAACSEEDFMSLRFGYRSSYLPAASARYLSDGVPSGKPPEQRRELLSYLGIGPKVANCIMLFGLRDIAAFPIDTWIKKYMADVYGFDPGDVRGMQAFAAERFGEYGGMAQQYIFFYNRG